MNGVPAFIADDPRFANMIATAAGSDRIERIDTHGAAIFLAGSHAYKIKRPVQFPYMDLSTPSKRRAACAAEIRLNRRTAPQIYLGLAPVADVGERLVLGEVDAPIDADAECVVVMRQFDQATLFDRLAASDQLSDGLVVGLAERIAAFHDEAEVLSDRGGGAQAMRWVAEENLEELTEWAKVLDPQDVAQLRMLTIGALDRLSSLMDTRLADGHVRRCHGDLHLRNVCLIDGTPTLFDALEFNESLAITDTQYDLAYVLMDLLHRDRRVQANFLLNRYLERRPDYEGLALLPFFMSVRASVRAKVSLSMSAVQTSDSSSLALQDEANDYLRWAIAILSPVQPRAIAIGGFSGSGKSTIARALAPMLEPAPGATTLRSDVIRKSLLGVDDHTRLGSKGYGADVSRQVYEILIDRAETTVRGGFSAIGDATFTKAEGRDAFAQAVEACGVRFFGFWLDADQETLVSRVTSRTGDPSDADAEVVRRQLDAGVGELDWVHLDANRSAVDIAADIATRVTKTT
jgi:aminoglycoside phosphotransferase family enzyme/predicted kinase